MNKKINSIIQKYTWLQISRQLLAEFFAPLLISITWTLWDKENQSVANLLQQGIVHFFAVGWAFSQWNRVKKQINTEKGLHGVGQDVRTLLGKLEHQTDVLVGYSTGAGSFCEGHFLLTPGDTSPPILFLRHHGEYPIFDLQLELTDNVDAADALLNGRDYKTQHDLHIFPSFYPQDEKTIFINPRLKTDHLGRLSISLKYKSRSGDYRQEIVGEIHKDAWVYATRILKNSQTILKTVPENFTRDASGDADWYHAFRRGGEPTDSQ
jgi:hypothetical protein